MRGKKPFSKINIEIGNICNLQCSFCPAVERPDGLMDLALFEKIAVQIAPLTELVCLHLMGDPLVHPRLAEIVDICAAHGLKIFLVTNGVLLRESAAQLLLHPAFYQVNFSLHSFPDNYPEKDPATYLQKVFQFTETALTQRPDLYLNYRLWNLSGPRGTGSQNRDILRRIEERFHQTLSTDVDVRVAKSQRIKNRLYLHFDTEFVWPGVDLPVLGERGTCYGLKSHFGILVDGTVVPCCLDKEGVIALGNIRDRAISEILQGARAQAMLQGFRDNKLVEALCRRCNYIERFQPNL